MSSSESISHAPPVVFPAPGWLFFIETLPLGETASGAVEDTVQLSLDSHAPLPIEQLAYGWCVDAARKSLVYYATARERLRQCANGVYDRTGFLIPDFALAPQRDPGVWQWLATSQALTAVRFGNEADFPAEVRSWPLPPGEPHSLVARVNSEREAREPQCQGRHAEVTLFWAGAEYGAGGRTIVAEWTPFGGGKARAATLPVSAAWSADVRERSWLARARKNRASLRLINKLTLGAVALWVLVAGAGTALYLYTEKVDAEAEHVKNRQVEVDSISGKVELVAKLDQLEAGKVSFFDALATLNHYRPMDVLFSRAEANSSRQIQVNGTAGTITQINNYVDALRKNGSFTAVEPRVNTAGGRTSFDLKVTVGHLSVLRSNPEPTAEDLVEKLEEAVGGSTAAETFNVVPVHLSEGVNLSSPTAPAANP